MPQLTEKAFQAQVVDLAKWHRLLVFHPYDSRRSTPGYPDLTIVGPQGVLWAELKTTSGRLSSSQLTWIRRLEAAGQEVHVWRPPDLPAIRTRRAALAAVGVPVGGGR